jgi:hypothetical protein
VSRLLGFGILGDTSNPVDRGFSTAKRQTGQQTDIGTTIISVMFLWIHFLLDHGLLDAAVSVANTEC